MVQVASSCAVIWKEPSPSIAITSSSGRPTLAPMAAGTAKPMVPAPPELIHERGRENRKYCDAYIWCWPTPEVSTALPAVSADTRSTTYCGLRRPSRPWS